MNCTTLDAAWEDVQTLATGDASFAVGVSVLVLFSSTLLLLGETLLRPLSALVAAVVAGVGLFALTSSSWDCEVRLGASGLAAVLAATLVSCVLKTSLFALGSAGFGAVAHLVYEAVVSRETPEISRESTTPSFLGRDVYYYAAVGGASVVGGVVTYVRRRFFVRLVSSFLGGSGITLAVHLCVERFSSASVSPVAALTVFALLSTLGVLVQPVLGRRMEEWNLRKRRRREEGRGRRGERGARREDRRQGDVVMGVAV